MAYRNPDHVGDRLDWDRVRDETQVWSSHRAGRAESEHATTVLIERSRQTRDRPPRRCMKCGGAIQGMALFCGTCLHLPGAPVEFVGGDDPVVEPEPDVLRAAREWHTSKTNQ